MHYKQQQVAMCSARATSSDIFLQGEKKMTKYNYKRQWVKPELTILFRSTTEEAVLFACKNKEVHGDAGPNRHNVCASPGNDSAAWCRQENVS